MFTLIVDSIPSPGFSTILQIHVYVTWSITHSLQTYFFVVGSDLREKVIQKIQKYFLSSNKTAYVSWASIVTLVNVVWRSIGSCDSILPPTLLVVTTFKPKPWSWTSKSAVRNSWSHLHGSVPQIGDTCFTLQDGGKGSFTFKRK